MNAGFVFSILAADNNGYVHSCPIVGLNGYECTFAIRKVLPAHRRSTEMVMSILVLMFFHVHKIGIHSKCPMGQYIEKAG